MASESSSRDGTVVKWQRAKASPAVSASSRVQRPRRAPPAQDVGNLRPEYIGDDEVNRTISIALE